MAVEHGRTDKVRSGLWRPILLSGMAVIATACSGGDDDSRGPIQAEAEQMVEGSMGDATGLGDLRPSCEEVADPAVGSTFECTAITDEQRTVWIDGVINAEGRIELTTRNVIRREAIPSFETAAVEALNFSVGTNLTPGDVDCGDEAVVLGSDQVMICAVTDPNTAEVFDVTMTMTDVEARRFSLVVSSEPRVVD